jgi:hypothetical protein
VRCEPGSDVLDVSGETAAWIVHDQRDVPGFLIDRSDLSLREPVCPGILSMIRREYYNRVLLDFPRKILQRIQHPPDLTIDDARDLSVTIEPTLPVAEWHFAHTEPHGWPWTRIPLDCGRVLRRIVRDSAPNKLRHFAKEDLRPQVLILKRVRVFPIGR